MGALNQCEETTRLESSTSTTSRQVGLTILGSLHLRVAASTEFSEEIDGELGLTRDGIVWRFRRGGGGLRVRAA